WDIALGRQEMLISRFESSTGTPPGAISRANLDGSGFVDDFISGADFPQGIDLTEPSAGLSPTSRDFGSLSSGGTTGVTESFTLTSSGDAPLTVVPGGITIAETDGANFGLVGGTCLALSVSLANGQSCSIDVRFNPVTAGSKSATLSVATNADTRSAALTGTGVAPPSPDPGPSPTPGPNPLPSFSGLAFSPSSKSARAPRRGKKYVTLKLRLANRGDASGTATVSLRSGSRHVKVPSRVSIKAGAGSTASKTFRASVYSRARGTVRVTAKLADGGTAQLKLRVRR
ncbi:MAG: choice-of-anchor D domain-containing protein, partial [Solirubrobacterales bacterium]